MRYLLLGGIGVALGLLLTALSRYRGSGRFVFVLLLFLRLLLFVLVVGWCARQFGPASGLAVIAGTILTRAVLVRRS